MIKSKSFLFVAAFAVVFAAATVAGLYLDRKTLELPEPGEEWLDTDGRRINAHGGCILEHDGTYYWFGEHKSDTTHLAMVGVTVYSSKDLNRWKYEGVALSVDDADSDSDIRKGCIMERPKVIYNRNTGKFVMWFHLELKGEGYLSARSGVAVSDNVTGPYRFLRSGRINPGILPADFTEKDKALLDTLDPENFIVESVHDDNTPQWREAVASGLYLKRDLAGGQMARDMTLMVDEDGTAWHIYSSEENLTLHIAELSDDYTSHTGRYWRMMPGGLNEAPAVFRHNGKYWMITSGCTGWAPNAARLFSADSITGPWRQHPNPCRGKGADVTFGGQGTFVLPVGRQFVFMADIWRPECHSDGRYMWLPISFDDGTPYLEHHIIH